jgi:hypothetical protein
MIELNDSIMYNIRVYFIYFYDAISEENNEL